MARPWNSDRELTPDEIADVEARKAILHDLKPRYRRGRDQRRPLRDGRFVHRECIPDAVILAAFKERGL